MRYYSEATVNGIIHDLYQGYDIPKATDYPSIEIPDDHGRIIDAGPLEELYDNLEADNGIYMEDAGETLQRILDAPTILEASKERE